MALLASTEVGQPSWMTSYNSNPTRHQIFSVQHLHHTLAQPSMQSRSGAPKRQFGFHRRRDASVGLQERAAWKDRTSAMAMDPAHPKIDLNSLASWMYTSRSKVVVVAVTVAGPPAASLDADTQYLKIIPVASYADSKPHRSVQWSQILSRRRDEAVALPQMQGNGERTSQVRLDLNWLDSIAAPRITSTRMGFIARL